jgi:hypothetical protein
MIAPTVALGYTGFGPVAVGVVAMLGRKKDSVVERLTLAFRHDDGSALDLHWAAIGPCIPRVALNLGVNDELIRCHRAIAVQIRDGQAVQDVFEFRSTDFWQTMVTHSSAFVDHARLEQMAGRVDSDQLRHSKAFVQMVDHYRNGFAWKSGRYTVLAIAELLGDRKPQARGWRFSVAEAEVDRLRGNIQLLERHFAQMDSEPSVPTDDPEWHWAYVQLEEESEFHLGEV